MEKTIFRRSSLERVSSPDQLDDYMRVSNPRIWTVLAAVTILLISFLVWGIFGKLPTTVSLKGIVKNQEVVCYVPQDLAEDIIAGDLAMVNKKEYEVTYIDSIPLSQAEVNSQCQSDYISSMLDLDEWNIKVTIEARGIPDGIVDVVITKDYINPISFLIN